MDPIRIISRIKNNRLMEWRESMGLSAKQASEKMGICYQHYLNIESCRLYPSLRTIFKISAATGSDAEWLFPEYLKRITNTVSSKTIPDHELVSLAEAKTLAIEGPDGDEAVDRDALKMIFTNALARLSLRERQVIAMHFGLDDEDELTSTDISYHLGVSLERVRQIEHEALGKLRHPAVLRELRGLRV